MKKRAWSFICVFIFMITTILQMPVISLGENDGGVSGKSYEIAVVFDNSGSMYRNEGWCRAKYAMEIFSSMINYEKDVLKIFPMWEVTTDGSTPEEGGETGPIEIRNRKDIDKISRMYTPSPDNTPLIPIEEAYKELSKSEAQEKWMVILTDGQFNLKDRERGLATIKSKTAKEMKAYLEEKCSGGIKIQYLGIGDAIKIEPNEEKKFYSMKSEDTTLKDDLINVCNRIFQRDELPERYIKGNKLEFDISMKNIIVFAQGKTAEINGLKSQSGKKAKKIFDGGQRKYSEISCGGDYQRPVDKDLAGQVVSFSECSEGEYTLDVSGAEKVRIFYEPDVELKCVIKNSSGREIDTGKKEIPAGKYTIEYKLADVSTGKDVRKSELLGDVKVMGYIRRDGAKSPIESGDKTVFYQDEEINVIVEASYLGKYKISTDEDEKTDIRFTVEGANSEKSNDIKAMFIVFGGVGVIALVAVIAIICNKSRKNKEE